MKRTAQGMITATTAELNICCDVGMDEIHVVCPPLEQGSFSRTFTMENRTDSIRRALEEMRDCAGAEQFRRMRIVVEPTGIYHQLLTRIARDLGYRTALVNAEHVVKMRTILFGDTGKTDRRDPHAIAGVVDRGRVIVDRQIPEVYQVMRAWSWLYQIAEGGIIEAKGRIHRALKYLFPDFDFGTDFLYSASGEAIMKCYEFDPHRLAAEIPSRVLGRLRRHSRIMQSSVRRLLAQARSSVTSTRTGPIHEVALEHLRLAWTDYTTHFQRREAARSKLQDLYQSARGQDPRLPAPVHRVITLCGLARLFAELGPLSDFQSWRQVVKLGGLNLRERKSGRYVGLTKITHKGRSQLRRVVMQLILPLVRRGELFGAYYSQKTKVQKMPGTKAMTAVGRKFLKMVWGWSRSSAEFDATRVFSAASVYRAA